MKFLFPQFSLALPEANQSKDEILNKAMTFVISAKIQGGDKSTHVTFPALDLGYMLRVLAVFSWSSDWLISLLIFPASDWL